MIQDNYKRRESGEDGKIFDELNSRGDFLKTSDFNHFIKNKFMSCFMNFLKFYEKLGCRVPSLGRFNEEVFYRPIVESELELAGLNKNSDVLVVGCGPLNSTGVLLSRNGHNVTCIDNDDTAIKYANTLLEELGEDLNIRFIRENGEDIDYSNYDAVWITLHVNSKREIIGKALREMRGDGKIIFRNPRGGLKKIYPSVNPDSYQSEYGEKRQVLGKKSILIARREARHNVIEDRENSRSDNLSLEELSPGEESVIQSSPDDPILKALGMREGKKIRFETIQPFGGPFIFSVNGRKIAIDQEIAGEVLVR